jgi:CubicO group peptidase (beta-lactamase class C family)
VIDHPMAHDPGDHYSYSDGDAVLASHVFQKETGQNIAEYAKKYLFAPLGILDTYWKQTPAGIADTESGVYMRPADLAKIGELYLHNGSWEGRQLVSPEWVRQSVTDHAAQGNGGYGFYWRLRSQGNEQDFIFSAHGFGGQGMHVNPKRNLVVVVYGWHIPNEGTAQEDILKRVLAATSTESCPAAR